MSTAPLSRLALAAILALAASACAQKTALMPVEGQSLPQAAYGQSEQPDSDDLLELDPQAAPERTVELRRRSEPREDDPFDLPPPE